MSIDLRLLSWLQGRYLEESLENRWQGIIRIPMKELHDQITLLRLPLNETVFALEQEDLVAMGTGGFLSGPREKFYFLDAKLLTAAAGKTGPHKPIERMRRAIEKLGAEAPSKALLAEAGGKRQENLAALRELQTRGEYKGHQRKSPPNRR